MAFADDATDMTKVANDYVVKDGGINVPKLSRTNFSNVALINSHVGILTISSIDCVLCTCR